MPFLIHAYWYEAQASVMHIDVTGAQVRRQFQRDRHQQFRSDRAFRRFLKQTGQNISDILLRVREDLIHARLVQRFAGQRSALDRVVCNTFRPTTSCRQPYSVPTVCGHTISTP